MTVTMSPTSVVSLPDDPFTIENICMTAGRSFLE